MDAETVDRDYAQLQQQAQQTSQLVQALATKLQAATAAGDTGAREWVLDLREIAIGIRDEENQTSQLLASIHAMVDNHLQQTSPLQPPTTQPQYPQPQYPQPQYSQPQGGGMMQRFLGGGFGRAITTGAGFGIGDQIIQSIF